jgi:putative transposase
MPDYRRNRVAGGTFFFTVNLRDRHSHLLVMQIDVLHQAVRQVRARAPFRIDAWVVLPDHMHCLWTLPEGDADFPGRWRAIKIAFAKSLPRDEPRSPVMARRGERGIWQRRYWEDPIRDDRDFGAHFDYTHFNPGQARSGATPYGLAAFFVSSVCGRRAVSCRVDRQRRTTGDGRAAMRSKPPDRGRRNALRFSTLRLLFNTNVLGVLLATREAVKHFGSSAAISSGRRCSRLRSVAPDSRPTSPQLWCFWLRTMPAG